ncbi:phospholipid carrier-dependent glycosyltransferase [Opitutaceae bacterium]
MSRTTLRSLRLTALGALCLLHVWMAASISRQFSTTADEIAHITAGYAYWTQHDYRFQPENGNLPQRWAALPLVVRGESFPAQPDEAWATADVWSVGRAFFYGEGNDLPSLLASARLMIALLSGALCCLIFIWTRALLGSCAGWIALTLAVFSPTLLAHGGLATSDTSAALGFVATILAWSRLMQRVTPGRTVMVGLMAGGLALSKYSAVLFAPVALIILTVRLTRRSPVPFVWRGSVHRFTHARRLFPLGGATFCALAVAVTVIWGAYGFRFSASDRPEARFIQTWDEVLLRTPSTPPLAPANGRTASVVTPLRPGLIQHTVAWMRDRRLLPEAYLYGLAFVDKHARSRLAYFAGEYRTDGWWEFFPTAFLLKTTLPTLALLGLGIAALLTSPSRRRSAWLYRLTPVLALLLVYGGFSLQSRLNIGHRHLLPLYPAVFLLAGASALAIRRWRWLPVVIGLLLIWHIRESVWIRPHYLAYFNPIGGGPEKAHRLFVDSSLDWGQDLPGLRAWLAEQAHDERVYLSYFGSGDPVHEGITATRFGDGYFDWAARTTPPSLGGGIYCISATMFRRVYTHVRGPWDDAYEQAYQQLRTWLRAAEATAPGSLPRDIDGSALAEEEIRARLFRYEQLQFGRLCHFLEQRQVDAAIGYSILIFRLTEDEVQHALYGPLPSG